MKRELVLTQLMQHQGQYLSGQELADSLGISRVAVWKHIEGLKEQGYAIKAVSGSGYRLDVKGGVILPAAVKASLDGQLLGSEIVYLPRLDSTSATLKRWLKEQSLPEGMVLVAGRQEQGRGRMGRSWQSPAGGMWMSVLLRPQIALERIALLSLVFAVAVASALEEYLPAPARIKWPNDVYFGGKKLAGILLEISGEMDGLEYLIVGIGINVNTSRADFTPEIQPFSTSLLEESKIIVSHNKLLAGVLHKMEEYYIKFLRDGFEDILHEFKASCLHLGRKVEFVQDGRVVAGVNVDINTRGHLLVDNGGDITEISTGDVRVLES